MRNVFGLLKLPQRTAIRGEEDIHRGRKHLRIPKLKILVPTTGGLQFWSDIHLRDDWRIQQHILTGRCRLINRLSFQRTAGTEEHCRSVLDNIEQTRSQKTIHRQVVLLLHGIICTRYSMWRMARRLKAEGFAAYTIAYASTRASIESHAINLQRVVSSLGDADELYLVGHSMGGLVIRAYLARHVDPRLKRVVMLGTPNQGAEKADLFRDWAFYRLLYGRAGQQLVTSIWGGICRWLPSSLMIETGIIAGGRGKPPGYSFLLRGDNDGLVTVESTRLAGATDFAVVRCLHPLLPGNKQVLEMVTMYLENGYFRSEAQRQLITAPLAAADRNSVFQLGLPSWKSNSDKSSNEPSLNSTMADRFSVQSPKL